MLSYFLLSKNHKNSNYYKVFVNQRTYRTFKGQHKSNKGEEDGSFKTDQSK